MAILTDEWVVCEKCGRRGERALIGDEHYIVHDLIDDKCKEDLK